MSLLRVAMDVERDHMCCSMEKDSDGFWFANCNCGDVGGPAPDADIAVDMHTAHVLTSLVERYEP